MRVLTKPPGSGTGESRGAGAPHQRTPAGEVLVVGLLFLAGTAALTWPWLARFGTHVVGAPGDNYEFLWKLWWVPHRLAAGRAPFFAENLFPQAGGYHLGSTDMSPVPTFLLGPLTAAVGAVAVYNLAMLLSFVLAGLGVYLLARRFGAGRLAAVIAGAAFAFGPFHFLRTAAHLNVAQIGFTPWVFLAADTLVVRRRLREGVWLGLFLALAALTTWYRLVFLAFAVPVFLLVRMRQTRTRVRAIVLPAAVAGLLTVLLVAPFALPVIDYTASGGRTPSFGDATFYVLSLEDYLMPPPGHPVLDHWIDEAVLTGNWERIAYPGIVVLLLAAAAIVMPSTRRRGLPVAGVALVGAVLSFGPVMRWFGEPVVVDIGVQPPSALHEVAAADPAATPTAMAVPMPAYLIARHAPGLGSMRAWARAAELAVLGADVLAAIGLTALVGRFRPPVRAAAGLAALALVLVDSYSGFTRHTLSRPAARPVDQWLAAQPGPARIVQMPYHSAQSGAQSWWSVFHGKDVVVTQASILPAMVEDARPTLERSYPQGREWVDILARWGVRYVLVDASMDAPTPGLEEALAGHGLRVAARRGPVTVYEIRPEVGGAAPAR